MTSSMRIALVSREIAPFSGGGIAPAVRAIAETLADEGHDVTLVTSDEFRRKYEQRKAQGDVQVAGSKVRWAFVKRPPEEGGGHLGYPHAWSASVLRTLRSCYPDGAPDVIEFADYLGEGFATVQARHTNDPWLADTTVAVRIHTTSEICAVLDGAMPDDHGARALFEMERYCLRHADRVIQQGGDVYGTYERFYGADALAPATTIPHVVPPHIQEEVHATEDDNEGPLRLLYLGRFERRKGVNDLVTALESVGDVRLTLLGGDTDTGPLAASLREQIEFVVEGDPRITLADPVPHDQVTRVMSEADVVVLPSRWECWPNVLLEALAANRPVLATPVGGMVEMVGDGGWLTAGTGPRALADAIDRLAQDPGNVRKVVAEGRPRRRFEQLVDSSVVLAGYQDLAAAASRRTRRPIARRRPPLVSVIVPYYQLDQTVEATLASLQDQDYSATEVVIANDGSLRREDAVLWELAERYGARVVTQPNSGLSAARNLAISQAHGEYVLPLDADDELEPSFVSRCLTALEADRDLAYVTTWVRYVDEDGAPRGDEFTGYFPFGNWSSLLDELNVAGTCSSVIRRSVFRDHGLYYSPELASYEDWALYRRMARAGLYGAVVPEPLFRYRVREESMTRQDAQPHVARLLAELRAHEINATTQWEAPRG